MPQKIVIPSPAWNSSLHEIILDLEKLRTKRLSGNVPPHIFFQLKYIFHFLETLGSVRIEGNNTTLSELIEKKIDKTSDEDKNESDIEIENLENAIKFIEENTDEKTNFSRAYISNIHKIITDRLTLPPHGEGSKYPGDLRKHNVAIKKSQHTPPNHMQLNGYFNGFLEFINYDHKSVNQLLMIAIAHHRFEYIHPFDNGNGRMGRLLNYSLLIKFGFRVKEGRIINSSSVFFSDRDKYYGMLLRADSLKDEDLLIWCEYFLGGLKNEIEKVDSILNKNYVVKNIMLPVIESALEDKLLTMQELKILKCLIEKDDMQIKSGDLYFLDNLNHTQKSRIINKLKDKGMIVPLKENGRVYTINFINNYLLRGVVKILRDNGFIADFLNSNS
jgi:Fic family protein